MMLVVTSVRALVARYTAANLEQNPFFAWRARAEEQSRGRRKFQVDL